MFNDRFFGLRLPFLAPDDMGGGGGSSDVSGGGSSSDTPAVADTPVDIDDNRLIRVKGSDKPVKFGDHVRGFQSQATKAAQARAAAERELATTRARLQAFEQERQRSANQAPRQADPYEALAQLPYLTGEHAVEVVRTIGEQIKQRDQVILGLLKQFKETQGIVNNLHRGSTNQQFEAKISKFITDAGLPPEASDWAKETYLAYEGDDLDQEFPQILSNRWEQLNRLFEAKRQAAINANRKTPFLPGKGGQTAPSKPLEVKANATAKEMADQLFGLFGESGT